MVTYHPNADRLAEYLLERRQELGLTQDDLRPRGGPSQMTVMNWERGELAVKHQAETLAKFDKALDWETGSAEAILNGGEPVVRGEYPGGAKNAEEAEFLEELTAQLKKRLDTIVRLRKEVTDPRLSAELAGLQADLTMDVLNLREHRLDD